jgi:hypothetical protein
MARFEIIVVSFPLLTHAVIASLPDRDGGFFALPQTSGG